MIISIYYIIQLITCNICRQIRQASLIDRVFVQFAYPCVYYAMDGGNFE